MSKNYNALHYIKTQMSEFDPALLSAVQKLFNIEDQRGEKQGCVIDSVALFVLFRWFGVDTEIHLGEICADGNQDAYHCWLTLAVKLIDIGIYGNSNYNSLFSGPKFPTPFILESFSDLGIVYADGSTEISSTWLSELSEKPLSDYIKSCPGDRVCKLVCESLNCVYSKVTIEKIYKIVGEQRFPMLKELTASPSGRN